MSALDPVATIGKMLDRLTFNTAPKTLAGYVAARDAIADLVGAIAELVDADRELDAAADELADAKRAKGNWRVNPLPHNHPAVVRMRAAKERRAAALSAFGESA